MVKKSKKFISVVMTLAVVSGFTFTCIPAYETKAATSVLVNESQTDSVDIMTAVESEAASYTGTNYGLCDNIRDGVILHCWSWSCNAIRENMKDIAEAGYTAVQTSPINNINESHTTMKLMGSSSKGTDGAWWWYYQPTDWKIGNYVLGSRDDFKAMCEEAEKYGIKVIVDVVPNHTTGSSSRVSQQLIDTAGGIDKLYHSGYKKPIKDYDDRYQCTLYGCCNGGLYDVNTENPSFQKYFVEYLNDCIDCGADGFRYDTAKHIGLPSDPVDSRTSANGWSNNFWSVATGKESVGGVSLKDKDRIFNYGEVLQGSNCKETEYAKYVSLTASSYGDKLRDKIGEKSFNAGELVSWKHPTNNGKKLVTWVESHDTYCNDGESAWMGDWQIRMCWAVIAARRDGTPLFFNRPDGSNGKSDRWGNNVLGAKGNDQFKDPEVVAVNKFRNAMIGKSEYMRNYDDGNKVLAIERGSGKDAGVTIINLSKDKSLKGVESNLADGTYYDKVYNKKFVVSGGKFTEGTAKGGKITVLYEEKVAEITLESDKESGTFKEDSIDVTLSAKNCTNAKYKIDDKDDVSFTDGQTINIGSELKDGESTTLTLTATDSKGNKVTKNYTYKKKIIVYNEGYLYADKVNGWDDMYAYVYIKNSESTSKIASWPGVKMTYNSEEERYEYKLPEKYQTSETKVIFTDGNNQMPAAKKPGKYFEVGKAMCFDGTSIELVEPTNNKTIELPSDAISFDKSSPQQEGTAIKITTLSATNAIGTVSYQFEINGEVVKPYSSDKFFDWTPNKSGDYKIKVIAKDSKGQASVEASYTITQKAVIQKLTFISTTITSDNTNVGTPVKLAAKATGGEGSLKYRFISQKDGKTKFVKDYSTASSVTWTPTEAGTYKLTFKVKDSTGEVIYKVMTYVVEEVQGLKIDSITTNYVSPQALGKTIKVTASATGAKDLQYRFWVHDILGNWTLIQDFSSKNYVNWKAEKTGNYAIWVDVKDSNNNYEGDFISYKIK